MHTGTQAIDYMSEIKRSRTEKRQEIATVSSTKEETIQNEPPFIGWPNFDVFWSTCVKGGSSVVKSACIAHLKSIGVWEDQSRWVEGLKHYGVPVEK